VGLLSLNLDQTVLQLVPRKYLESLVAGPGFEPGGASASKDWQVLSVQQIRGLKNRKVG